MRGWTRLRRWATEGPAFPLGTFLLLALLLRLPAVALADGYEFLDQQYQYVDPAFNLASGLAWLPTWEYEAGIRSHVYPHFLAWILRGGLAMGLTDPLWLMRYVRLVHGLLSLLPMALFWLCVVRWRPIERPRLPLLLFAGSGLVVALAVQPSGLAWGGTLAVGAVLAAHGPRAWPLLAGLLLGLGFTGRFQDALYGPALAVGLLWQRRLGGALLLAAGCLPGLLLQGLVDVATVGRFFGSPLAYLAANSGGGASRWGTEPFWYYALAVIPLVGLLPPWSGRAVAVLRAGTSVLPLACAAAAFHLLVHSGVERKALRFEYGALALLVGVVAAGLGAAPKGSRAAGHQRLVLLVQAGFLVWASFWFGHRGPVLAAMALAREPEFSGELLVVDGDGTSIGGALYLARERLVVTPVSRAELAARVAAASPGQPLFVWATRQDLAPAERSAGDWHSLGAFTGPFDLRRSDRTFVWRVRR